MSVHAPPKLLVEKYLIEIAKMYNIEFTPDPQVTLKIWLMLSLTYQHHSHARIFSGYERR